jgi:2'-5' RNA ligase
MIALLPHTGDVARFALDHDNAEPPDQMHVTLQYLGDDVTGWDPQQQQFARNAAEQAVSDLGGPLRARVFAHATFNPDGHDGRDPCAVYLVGDSDRIGPVQRQLTTTCAALLGGAHPGQHEPFTPHMTAGYGLTAADLSEVGPITFDRVGLFLADQRTELPLNGAAPAANAVRDAWVAGYASTGHQVTELAQTRVRAVQHAALEQDDPPADADVVADGATTGLLAATSAERDRAHRDSAAALAAVLALLASRLHPPTLRAAIQPDAARPVRRDQATTALLAQATATGVLPQWRDTAVDAHTTGTVAGAAAAGHILSHGVLPAAATPGVRSPISPGPWVEEQISGLAGDLAAAAIGDAWASLSDADIADIIRAGAGAQYYLDVQLSQAFLDGSVAVYRELGIGLLDWRTVGGPCRLCLDKEAGSPYTVETVPAVEHGGCRCMLVPWG